MCVHVIAFDSFISSTAINKNNICYHNSKSVATKPVQTYDNNNNNLLLQYLYYL